MRLLSKLYFTLQISQRLAIQKKSDCKLKLGRSSKSIQYNYLRKMTEPQNYWTMPLSHRGPVKLVLLGDEAHHEHIYVAVNGIY